SDSFASNGFKRSSAQSAAERNFLPSSQSTETECVGGWVSQKPDDEIRCPNPLAYGRKKLMAGHAVPAASALENFPPFPLGSFFAHLPRGPTPNPQLNPRHATPLKFCKSLAGAATDKTLNCDD